MRLKILETKPFSLILGKGLEVLFMQLLNSLDGLLMTANSLAVTFKLSTYGAGHNTFAVDEFRLGTKTSLFGNYAANGPFMDIDFI